VSALEVAWHTVASRPYVFVLFALYLAAALRQFGPARTLALTVLGYGIALASEASSIRTGFPYGLYRYVGEGFHPKELRVLGVPFFDSLSYVFIAYASYALALFLLGPRSGGRRADGARTPLAFAAPLALRTSAACLLASAALFAALDAVIDPVTLLGDRWFLGRIYDYPGGGSHFGVPFSNYAGWFLTGLATIGLYQRVDRLLWRLRPEPPAPAPPSVAAAGPAIWFAIAAFNVGIALAIGARDVAFAGLFVAAPVLALALARLLAPATPPPVPVPPEKRVDSV
jgi:putative membrane protein